MGDFHPLKGKDLTMKKKNLIFLLLLATNSICAENISISTSALFWKADQEGLNYVIKNDQGTGSITKGSTRLLSPQCDYGFRINAQKAMPCYGVESELVWTHFTSHAHKNVTSPDGGALYSVWTSPNASLTSPTSGKGKWDLGVDVGIFEVSKTYSLSSCLDFKPHIGIIAASTRQQIDLDFSGGTSTGSVFTVLDDKIRMTNNYWGVGIQVGVDGVWDWTESIGLYFKSAFSILNGNFYLKQSESVLFDGINGAVSVLNIKDNINRSRVLAELGFGICWKTTLTKCSPFVLQLGWDQLYFFGQHQLKRFTNQSMPGAHVATSGDLTLQGVTLTGTFSF